MANEPVFFDSWSEGPFTYEAVAEMVADNPEAAHKFHTEGNVTFAEYQKRECGYPGKMKPEVCEAIEKFEKEKGRPMTRDEIHNLGSERPYSRYLDRPITFFEWGLKDVNWQNIAPFMDSVVTAICEKIEVDNSIEFDGKVWISTTVDWLMVSVSEKRWDIIHRACKIIEKSFLYKCDVASVIKIERPRIQTFENNERMGFTLESWGNK